MGLCSKPACTGLDVREELPPRAAAPGRAAPWVLWWASAPTPVCPGWDVREELPPRAAAPGRAAPQGGLLYNACKVLRISSAIACCVSVAGRCELTAKKSLLRSL